MTKSIWFFVLFLLILSCNSKTMNSVTKIGDFTFSLPKGSKVYFTTSDSTEGEIIFKHNFTGFFTKGYFSPAGFSQVYNYVMNKDTIGRYIISMTVRLINNKYNVLYYAWDSSSMTTLILNEKRYYGIVLSAVNLDSNQKVEYLNFLKSCSLVSIK